MFDQETIQLLNALPSVKNLSGASARTHLTQTYLELIQSRVSGLKNTPNLPENLNDLRRMANGLEIYCLIEFAREGRLLESGRSAAFVAAQSLELLSNSQVSENQEPRHVLAGQQTMSLIESGLLYLIAGYYANAATNAKSLPTPQFIKKTTNYAELRQNMANNVLGLLTGLIRLDLNVTEQYHTRWSNNSTAEFLRAPSDLSASAEGQLLSQIGHSTKEYLHYLAGGNNTFSQTALERMVNLVSTVSQAMNSDSIIQPPAESLLPYHLASLLEIVFGQLQNFSTVHTVFPPSDADEEYQSSFTQWLRAKAMRKHALLWPSTKRWLNAKHAENVSHTVVSMPTGSGKSFLAELALAERLHQGWGLYVVPMNALVRQIKRDLDEELTEIGIKEVRRFLIDEHTTLEDEIFTGASTKEIIIMTPEKALLAIRLKPEAFKICSVCIFDECHLIAKEDRGAISDDLLARLVVHAPDIHIMLMSAMVQNPDELADWLHKVTGKISRPISLNWKPTRSLRTLAIIPENQVKRIPKGKSQQCNVQLIGQASIAWQKKEESLYVDSILSSTVSVKKTENGLVQWNDRVNNAARQIGIALTQQNIPTILFITTASHVWSQGKQVSNLNWKSKLALEKAEHLQERVNAWLTLAEAELGSVTPLRKYHHNGVTVHSGALIDEERHAAEAAYKHGLVGLMIATSTLAQGLNLPSQAVVMTGNIKGNKHVGERNAADILNALGRSGRAGFYNVGLSILVPQRILRKDDQFSIPEYINNFESPEYVQLLRKEDACLNVTSALEGKVDKLIAAANALDQDKGRRPENLETATLIMETDTEHYQGSYFKYSYAAHLAQSEHYVEEGVSSAQKLVNFYTNVVPCPDWMPELAQRSGLSITWLSEMHKRLEEGNVSLDRFLIPHGDFQDTLLIFQEVIKNIDSVIMVDKFGRSQEEQGYVTKLTKLPKKLRGQDFNWSTNNNKNPSFDSMAWKKQWDGVFDLLNAWVSGHSFTKIATTFFELEPPAKQSLFSDIDFLTEFPRSAQQPLHKAIKNIKSISYPLRHVSGGFVLLITKMLIEKNLIETEEDIPLSVGMLPQAIHWGVDRLDKAFWYYNLLPVRSVAHTCAEVFPVQYEDDAQIKREVFKEVRKVRANLTPALISSKVSTSQKEILSAINTLLNS